MGMKLNMGVQARDRTVPESEYKGRPTNCADEECPCRPCWNAHDCGRYTGTYTGDDGIRRSRWEVRMECATRHNSGCPLPKPEPQHVYASDRARVCKRCGCNRPTLAKRAKRYDELRSLIGRHLRIACHRLADLRKQQLRTEEGKTICASVVIMNPTILERLQADESLLARDLLALLNGQIAAAEARRELCIALLAGEEPEEEEVDNE